MAVHIQNIGAARNMIKILHIGGKGVMHNPDIALCHGARTGVVDIGNQESFHAFTEPVNGIGIAIPHRHIHEGIDLFIGIYNRETSRKRVCPCRMQLPDFRDCREQKRNKLIRAARIGIIQYETV